VSYNADELYNGIISGNRRSIAKAFSLVESTLQRDSSVRYELLSRLEEFTSTSSMSSLRVGITGSPGVGKSSLIEALGGHIISEGSKVAVLAIDPSSVQSGGSILGDKVRMPQLTKSEHAFIRPSPNRGRAGGTTSSTRDCIIICEAAGYDVTIVETVGAGQSEVEVSDLVDICILLLLPNAGDDIQGIKRGIMEVADIIAITKYDVSEQESISASAYLKNILSLMKPRSESWKQVILSVSAHTSFNIPQLWDICKQFSSSTERDGLIERVRNQQTIKWFSRETQSIIMSTLKANSSFKQLLDSPDSYSYQSLSSIHHEILTALDSSNKNSSV
jgi:LAO/AO transport system kinase